MVSNKNIYKENTLLQPEKDVDMKANAVLTHSIHYEFKDVFIGIGCFKGSFLKVKDRAKPHQVALRYVTYILQNFT